jgi:hypothetical protein
MRQLHPGPERDVHEVHNLRLNKRLLVRLSYPLL